MLPNILKNHGSNKAPKQDERQEGQDQFQRLCQLPVYFWLIDPHYDPYKASIDQANIVQFL